ncbi:MAG: sigma-70 family RNA polymerase sigma factor [Verrucomicrobiaceae bacterium]|nr:MAG: sigma-70 family RNA polymerase sigma factor [Verrucomicrobiaceae bacterium]
MDTPSESNPSDEAALLQSGYRFALSLTHHREEAEDLIQETWLNLCRRYGRVESRAVLFTSLRNLFIDQCRRKKVIFFESLDQPDVSEVADLPADEPCLKGEISGLLGALRPAEREAIFLHYYEGHTAEEIGRMTEQPRGTVLSLLHRAIAKLRKAAESTPGAFPRNQLLLLFVVLAATARSLNR